MGLIIPCMRKIVLIVIGLLLFSFVLSISFFPYMPEKMATHWNIHGEADGSMSKFWGLFFLPVLLTGLSVMLLLIPNVDPEKKNIEKFRVYYDRFIVIFILFMLLVQIQTLLWNFGIKINPNFILPVGIGFLFYYIGILIEKAERNWFIGVRTPWTLNSDKVWKKTNLLGGKLFKIAGIIAIFGSLFPVYAFFFILIPVLFVVGFTIMYSYKEAKKESEDTGSPR